MSEVDATLVPNDDLAEGIARYRDVRERIERGMLPLATSVDGLTFEFQASLHGLSLRRGAYVVLEHEDGQRLGQVTDVTSRAVDVEVPGGDGATSSVRIRAAVGAGLLLDSGGPFHDAHARPAASEEVGTWLAGTRRGDRASLVIGELSLAPGVPAELDSGGFNRHTFMCGQSGSGKTYSLGLLLEQVLAETTLRIVILDPNSDYVGLGRVRDSADPSLAERYQAVTDDVAVWSNDPGADRMLRLRFTELDGRTQGAILGLDPVADREEYAVLTDLLRTDDDSQPSMGLEQLTGSSIPSAQRLGMRAGNLGIFDWSLWSRDEPSLLQELKQPTSRCIVVDLGSLETPEEQRTVADAVLASMWSLRRSREPVLLVIDEAHNICAAEPENAMSRISTERAIQIAAEARKFGIYLLVSTQRPNKVHENIVSQCDNLLLMRMNSTADVADLSRLFSFVPPGLMAGAPSFGMGQALVAGKISPPGAAYVQMGARVSQEGGADIPTAWAQVRTS
jgi:DNA helicase HerA-like ATPase